MTLSFPLRTVAAATTAMALTISPAVASGTQIQLIKATEGEVSTVPPDALPVPGYVTVDVKPLGSESVFTATVLPNISGDVLFVVTTAAEEGKQATEVTRKQKPIKDGRAEFRYALPAAGSYVVQATVLREGKAGEVSAPYAFTIAEDVRHGGSSIKANVTAGDIAGPIVGAVVSLAVLIGSQTSIPGIERALTDSQKALGVYNPQMVQLANQAIPVAGGVVGAAGLIAAIVQLVKALKETNVEVTVTDDA